MTKQIFNTKDSSHKSLNGKTTRLSAAEWSVLRAVGRLYLATRSTTAKQRLVALVREASDAGGTTADIAAASFLIPSTIRRYLKN